jgi:hypothetical protein
VPTRALFVFAAMENVTLPLPLPLVPETIANHGTVLVAAHVQPVVVETAIGEPAPPAAPTDCDVGATDTEQFPAWIIENCSPEIDTLPVRVDPGLAPTENLTLPAPLPLAPDVIAIQDAEVVAFHTQPVAAFTATVPAPPAAGRDALVG